jgi:hypothetical protein
MFDSPGIDALAYSQFNNILSTDQINGLTTNNPFSLGKLNYYIGEDAGKQITYPGDTASPQVLQDYYNAGLNATSLKRACCNSIGKAGAGIDDTISVDISIPLTESEMMWATNGEDDAQRLAGKFGVSKKTITIPKSLCTTMMPDYKWASGVCDDFYKVYCNNVKEIYRAAVEGEYNPMEFAKYKPECACYGDVPNFIKQLGENVPAKCYMNGCFDGNASYLDAPSREDCHFTICQANVNIDAPEAKYVDPEIYQKQSCGSETSNQTTNNTPSPTTAYVKTEPLFPIDLLSEKAHWQRIRTHLTITGPRS